MNNGFVATDCPCPWRPSPTPCIDHSHHRASAKASWECFMHDHDNSQIIADQPPPIPNGDVAVWDLVIADMQARDQTGRERYGTPLQVENGRDHLVDAYQEGLDFVVYVRAEIERRKKVASSDQVIEWLRDALGMTQEWADIARGIVALKVRL